MESTFLIRVGGKMKKWLSKHASAFVLGFLDNLKEYRSTPDYVVEALNVVTEFIKSKYWR